MLKAKIIVLALALAGILYVKFFVNIHEIVGVATENSEETPTQQTTQ